MSKARDPNSDLIDRQKELEQKETAYFRLLLTTRKNLSEARIFNLEISDSQKLSKARYSNLILCSSEKSRVLLKKSSEAVDHHFDI